MTADAAAGSRWAESSSRLRTLSRGASGGSTASSAALVPGLLERLERKLASGALGVWEGFSRICEEEIELPAEKLLRATFTPALEDIGWVRGLCERLEVEGPATLEECREAMSSHWQRRLGR